MAEDKGSVVAVCSNYGTGMVQLPHRLVKRAFARKTKEESMELDVRESKNGMKRTLGWFDMVMFGVASMVGSGVFVITGSAANGLAGPAVIVSYLFAGLSALLSSFCYTEFAVEMPIAGGAFSYTLITFGELPAFITMANLVMEYTLSIAAVARAATSYLAYLCDYQPNDFRIDAGFTEIDMVACGFIILLTVLISISTKESSTFNIAVQVIHFLVIAFIIIAGFVQGSSGNLKPFTPFGSRGVFDASTQIFFAFVGFDAVSTLAEEVRVPKRDLPIGISLSVIIVTIIYALMALALVLMVPYDLIDPDAPYAAAFQYTAGWNWAQYVVSAGALIGIIATLEVTMIGQARYLLVVSRTHMLPPIFAQVSKRFGTPIFSTVFLSLIAMVIAFFTDFSILANLVSIGTLFVFYVVAAALIFHRTYKPGVNSPWPSLIHIFLLVCTTIGFSTCYRLFTSNNWGLLGFGVATLLVAISLRFLVPEVHKNDQWTVPLMPFPAVASMLMNAFLLGTLDSKSYIRFGAWTGFAVLFYILYSVHATYLHAKADKASAPPPEDSVEGSELKTKE